MRAEVIGTSTTKRKLYECVLKHFFYDCYQVGLISLNDLCRQLTPNFRNTFKFKYLSNISMGLLP
jgi:hypothetical protein